MQPELSLGAHVRTIRQTRRLSIRRLAVMAGVDATWISRLERDRYLSPDARSLSRLARALEVDVGELYRDAGYGRIELLPGFQPYLRTKYQLPDEAVAQLAAHFDLLRDKFAGGQGDGRRGRNHDPAP